MPTGTIIMPPFQPNRPAEIPALPDQPDDPQAFGYKTTWWALPTSDTTAVVEAIELKNPLRANWRMGIHLAYKGGIYVAPPVDGWTLITGFDLPPRSETARDEAIYALLALSKTFGTALVFGTHRVVEYHIWAKAVAGALVRGYGWIGESGRTFWDEGPLTPEEQELGLTFANESKVMAIARKWSIAPCDLANYKLKQRRLGVLGSYGELFRRDSSGAITQESWLEQLMRALAPERFKQLRSRENPPAR
jgi:hypothetical protein